MREEFRVVLDFLTKDSNITRDVGWLLIAIVLLVIACVKAAVGGSDE